MPVNIIAEQVKREVALYAGMTHGGKLHTVLDDQNQRYAVVFVPESADERPSYVITLARIVDDYIVIDEDGAIDKPLHQALMVNANIPLEQIILAYQGETTPAVEEQ